MCKPILYKAVPLLLAVAAFAAASASTTLAVAAPSAGYDEHVTVHYSLPHQASIHTHNHGQAHRLANFVRSLGCQAHVDHDSHGGYTVSYGGHGSREHCFDCDQEAHAFANRLNGLGFTAHVHH